MELVLQKKKKPEYLNSSVKLRDMVKGWTLLRKVRVLDCLYLKRLLNYTVEIFGSNQKEEIWDQLFISHY